MYPPLGYRKLSISSLIRKRAKIKKMQWSAGILEDEKELVTWVEDHCVKHFNALLQALEESVKRTECEYPESQWKEEGILRHQAVLKAAQTLIKAT